MSDGTAVGPEPLLRYRERDGRLFIVHTEVPQEMQHRGLAAVLVRAALAKARAERLTVVPWCPYARSWLLEHSSEAGDVNIDWETLPPGGSALH
jgi:predicted GNAT family acetyltransferase